MSLESKLESWKQKCTPQEIMNWFVEKDHYKVGLDKGCSINQIMNDIGFKNPNNEPLFETLAKWHLRNQVHRARKNFERDGFIMSSKKFAKTPTIYFLIDNLSEERVERHFKLKKNAERGVDKFRDDKLTLLTLIDKVKDKDMKEKFKQAYASKVNLDKTLLSYGMRKKVQELLK